MDFMQLRKRYSWTSHAFLLAMIKSAIKALQKKSLITVRDDGKLDMHDLIRDMGGDVRQAEPYKRYAQLSMH
ncbi:hypothetical protein EJ110_NYTH17371 [Nymphaea thermarum]|nr:hypothetical protein EJ110_NYTH17371 [Nymphaea thermarum]